MEKPPTLVIRVARTTGPFKMLLDKMPGFWVILGWPAGAVQLRIRVAHDSGQEPCELFFDVRTGDAVEFECLGSEMTSLWALVHPMDETNEEHEAYPLVWRREFRHMATRWAACACILEFYPSAVAAD